MKFNNIQLIIFILISNLGFAQSFYIDNENGNDQNNGNSITTAWKSLNRVNSEIFKPGDSILFKRDGKWVGTMMPKGNGAINDKIVIGTYGNGKAPIIDAEGKVLNAEFMSAAVVLYNQEYWEIRDIEVRNFEKGNPEKPLKKAGILVMAKDIGTLHDFKIENVKIAHVNGSLKTRENGGVFFKIIADKNLDNRIPTNFDGIYINNCHFYDVERGGFLNQSVWKKRDFDSKFGEICNDSKMNTWFPSKNILIENCKFENIGGNGLVTRVADSPIVQYNLFYKNSLKTTGNASYPYNCDNALWQFNEASYTVYNEGDIDASGFDSDYMCKNTIIQYNYSHHNDWGGLLVCSWGKLKNSFNDGTIVRNNVFQDEQHHMIRFSGNITNTEISNNLFVTDSKIGDVMMWYKHWGEIWPDKTVIKNNIFYNQGTQNYLKLGEASNNTASENILSGSSFIDYSEFKTLSSRKDQRQLKSKVKQIKKIGKRDDFSISKAEEVIKVMWPNISTVKQ